MIKYIELNQLSLLNMFIFCDGRGWENESSWGQIGRYSLYFVNLRPKVITSRKYIIEKLFTCN